MPWPKIQMWCLVTCLRINGSKLHHEVRYDDQTASEYSGYKIRHQAVTPRPPPGAYTTARTVGHSEVFELTAHINRLASSCQQMLENDSKVEHSASMYMLQRHCCLYALDQQEQRSCRSLTQHCQSPCTLELPPCNAARQREPNALPGHNHSSFNASTVASKGVCISESSHEGLSAGPVSPRG